MQDDVHDLQARLVNFVRGFGLLGNADRTPCGVALPLSHAHALIELSRGPLTQRDLTRALRLERSTVSRLVDKLAAQGWVNASPAPHDGRSVLLSLSAGGKWTAEQLDRARAERFAALLEAIPEDRRADVLSALDLLVSVTDQLGNAPGQPERANV